MPEHSNALEGSNLWLKSSISPDGSKQQHLTATGKLARFMESDAWRAHTDKPLAFYPSVPKKTWHEAQRRYKDGHQSLLIDAGDGRFLLPTKWMYENELSVHGSVEEKRSHFERSAVTFLDICLNPKKACEENFGKGFFFSLNFSFF